MLCYVRRLEDTGFTMRKQEKIVVPVGIGTHVSPIGREGML